ncbi:ABC transporter ATP-binding protein [Crenalkalicoccus roseus]|uniref:ABC transporter ATP-binding protein n=1 Tax=Crenalkalicoccus roseus TaxID=1485588 RepID=UPI0010809414|nr:ABC transporter ATP-binding protein [Crenalkalicoccus roseus]
MIRLRDVTKVYRLRGGAVREVLSGVNASFARGEAVGILGRNGAGKTTLLRIVAGVEMPTRGRVERGMSVSWPLGFGGAMHYGISGADNARFIARIYGKPVAETVAFVEEFAQLGEYFRMPARTYSSGMLMRLGFALSMAVEFDCYLVDEVVATGDAHFAERCRKALEERRARSAILFVSHVPNMLRKFCTSGAVLRDGRLTRYDNLDKAIAAYHAA